MSAYVMYIFLEKKAKLFANSGDPDQMPRSALFANYLLAVSRIQWVKPSCSKIKNKDPSHPACLDVCSSIQSDKRK